MTQAEIDHYLEILDEPKRSTLRELRESILSVIPEADQGLSYNIPAFRLNGKVVAGFAAFKSHLSYLPFSGFVFPELRDDLRDVPDVHRRPAIPDRSALAPFLGREADCGPLVGRRSRRTETGVVPYIPRDRWVWHSCGGEMLVRRGADQEAGVKIKKVSCVAYRGSMWHPEAFWEERLIRPVDIYPQFRSEGPTFLPRSGTSSYEIKLDLRPHRCRRRHQRDRGTDHRGPGLCHKKTMAPLLVSQDPLATEQLWDILYRYCVHGRKGVEMMAISALDCALWDLKGRHFGVPVYVLLGGPTRTSVPAYVSALGYSLELDAVRARAIEMVAQGFRATKWFPRPWARRWGDGYAANLALASALREAVGPMST